jgi:hypothetical protein
MKAKPFLTWQKARDSCISMNADLLSVNDNEENVNVYNIYEYLISNFTLMFAQLLGIALIIDGITMTTCSVRFILTDHLAFRKAKIY